MAVCIEPEACGAGPPARSRPPGRLLLGLGNEILAGVERGATFSVGRSGIDTRAILVVGMLDRSSKRGSPPQRPPAAGAPDLLGGLDTRLDEAPWGRNPAAVALGRLGGLKGGKARAHILSAARRTEIASLAAKARWKGR